MHTIAIAGLGAIGQAVAHGIVTRMPQLRLSAVAVRDPRAPSAMTASLAKLTDPPLLLPSDQLHAHADIVVECGGAALLQQLAPGVLAAGKQLLVASGAALLAEPALMALAEGHRGQVLLPSGAIGGLDAVAAMAEGQIHSARLITRKPPAALSGNAWLAQQGIVVEEITQPVKVFDGPVSEAARYFPANLNVAAALALAGIGAERTQVALWADPGAQGNGHAIEVVADSGVMQFSIQASASSNPATSALAAQSILALLRKFCAPVRVG